jgi:2-polyprenyl-6-methoxyphenol hydroxylase-like FAD-dependent oxidoreductase
MQRIAQMNLEPVLLEAARSESNAQVEFGWSLFGFEQDETGVTAMIQKPGERHRTVRAQYLIGCDGPTSRVRHFLNVDYDGTRDLIGELFIVHFRSDRVADLYPNREPYWHTWLARPGFSGLLVCPDASRNDYVLHRPFAPRAGQSLESVIDAALGRKLPYEIVQSGPWRPQFLVAGSFGRGRVFVAGDATHQYMPTGGLGMNTGLLEAHNLAWKLSACLSGWGGSALMASYQAERLPAARRNREHVKENAAAVFEPQFDLREDLLEASAGGSQARDDLARLFVAKISRLYESMGIELGYRYADSPIVLGEADAGVAAETLRYVPGTLAGARLPNGWRGDGQSVLDQLELRGFTLLNADMEAGDTGAIRTAAAARRVPLRILHLPEPHLARVYERRWVLVRPDQHVAWRGDALPSNPLAILDAVRGAP